MERIQVLLDPSEKEQFRRLAQERGLSLSAWIREAALNRAAEESQAPRLRSVEELRAFFSACDARETGREPEWEEHLEVLDASRRDGLGDPARPAQAGARDGEARHRPRRGRGGDAARKRRR